jgi:hypothetical protein
MKLRRSLYARPEIVRGQQCAEALLDPGGSDQAAAGETLSRAGRRPHRRACMGCRAPQAPFTRTRLGVPMCGRSAWWPRRSGCRPRLRDPVRVLGQCPVSGVRCPVSGVRCPVRAISVHACLSTGPLSSVRCGRLSVQVSAVRRPVSASGVCALPRALCPAEVRSWSAAWAGRRMAGMAGVGVVARCVHARLVVCMSWEPGARSWRRRCWASRGVGLDLAVVVGGGWAWPARPRGRPG